MAIKRYPRKVTVQNAVASSSNMYLPRKAGAHTANSGCMRGNDTYGKNGSASVGIAPEPKGQPEPEQTYSDFMNFNYGLQSQRRYSRPEEG
ncbi:hypothetical protein [Pontibacter flavimaris]|uniref:Uncharacterized protein n=1 Tax=Pontibacter flavimaris TaxID=1797110 RepID=A0A1Q5P8U0_9BACT|nr:hypothetical protein [Pontibacter flavimaris]OKL38601.1 hypothetical protein A3841_05480 [Pontibacter flavimaris]